MKGDNIHLSARKPGCLNKKVKPHFISGHKQKELPQSLKDTKQSPYCSFFALVS
jgi:hypothetical protein